MDFISPPLSSFFALYLAVINFIPHSPHPFSAPSLLLKLASSTSLYRPSLYVVVSPASAPSFSINFLFFQLQRGLHNTCRIDVIELWLNFFSWNPNIFEFIWSFWLISFFNNLLISCLHLILELSLIVLFYSLSISNFNSNWILLQISDVSLFSFFNVLVEYLCLFLFYKFQYTLYIIYIGFCYCCTASFIAIFNIFEKYFYFSFSYNVFLYFIFRFFCQCSKLSRCSNITNVKIKIIRILNI